MRTLEEIIKELPENIRLPIYEAFQVFKEDIIHKELVEMKNELKEVWKVIKELAEAQKRTEERVEMLARRLEELAEAQKRTEERVEILARRLEELAEAQKRTEERVEMLARRLEELAEAQKRTEERVEILARRLEELAEAQKRTEERVEMLARRLEELAEAEKRTEERVEELARAQIKTEEEIKKLTERIDKLTEEHAKTREHLGGLTYAFGYVLEDRAMKSLPKILKKDYDIEIIGELKRDYIEIDGEYIEVNIYRKARKEGEEYSLIGEVKSRISKRVIDEFISKCEKISEKSIKVLISYIFTPEIKKYAEEKGIILISSYKLEL